MRRVVPICILMVGTCSSIAVAAPQWEKKSYSGGVEVCHEQVLFKSKWWAGASSEPNPMGPTSSNEAGWGNDPWLPMLNSNVCNTEQGNLAPVARAGEDRVVQSPNSAVEINATASFDPNGDDLSYQWQQISGPLVSIQNPTHSVATFALTELTEDTDFAFRLTVSDGQASAVDQVTITSTAAAANTPPIAHAGFDIEVQSPTASIRLDGSQSQDTDGDALSYQWRQLTGPTLPIHNANLAVAAIDVPSLEQDTDYSFELTVNDGQAVNQDVVQIYALAEPLVEHQGSIFLEMDQGDLVLPGSSQYRVVLTSLTTGEQQEFQLSAKGTQHIDGLASDDYQVWIEFDGGYQPINFPRVVSVTEQSPLTLSFRVKESVDLSELSTIDGLEVEKVIDGVFQARQIAWGDGYLFVGSSAIFTEDGHRGDQIYAIPYDYDSGAVGEPLIVASGLTEPHGVAYRDGTLYFATSSALFSVQDVVSKLGKSIQPEKLLDLPSGDTNFPLDATGQYWHQKHTLKFNSFDANDKNLYISVGSPCNICVIKEEPRYGSILKVNLQNLNVTQIAQGIRNTVGFDWDPVLGDLWFTDNNPQNTDGHTTYFPGEINKIFANQLASGDMPHFGFPYVSGKDTISITPEQEAGTASNSGGYDYLPSGAIYSDLLIEDIDPEDYQPPAFELEARSAPLGMTFWQPDGKPEENGQRSFVYTTHGPGDNERAGYELRIMTLDAQGTPIFDRTLLTGWKQHDGITGKPVELLVMPDNSLLVSDDAGNTLYKLQYNPSTDGRITLSPQQGEIPESDQLVQATLTDSEGVSRRLYMSLTSGSYSLEHLAYGDYTLTIPSFDGIEPTESVIQVNITEQAPHASLNWSYQKGSDETQPKGTLAVTAPKAPSDSAATVLLEMTQANDESVFIDSDWDTTTLNDMSVGTYKVELPYTESAIPEPKQQEINLSESGATLSWSYTEYENDEDYFNAVMEAECSSCHNGGNFAPDLTLGPTTALIEAYYDNPNIVADKMAAMASQPGVTCDSSCQATLTRYLEEDLWTDALPDVDSNSVVYGSRHLRLLTRNEYINTIRDLFDVQVDKALLPLDDKEQQGSLYGNSGQLGYLSSDKMNAYLNGAVFVQDNMDIYSLSQCQQGQSAVPEWNSNQVYTQGDIAVDGGELYRANWWTQGNRPKDNSGQYGQPWTYIEDYVAGDPDCLETWYWQTAERMFRRPMTEVDKALYPASDIELSLAKLLVSPHFLYRREAGHLNDMGNYHLNAYELANVISHTIVGSVPDQELWSKAKDGSLVRADILGQQIDRLLNNPKAHEQFVQFMMQTLEFDEERVLVQRDGMSSDVGKSMLEEFRTYIRETVFSEEMGRFSDLMSYEKTYVNQVLANHYGMSGQFNSDFSETNIPAERGTGLLSLGAIAVAYSSDEKTMVIPRGRMVQHSLLGWDQTLASGAAPEDIVGDSSSKDFWTKATGPATECWVCHEKMNDVGFAYDVLDNTGRYRAYEDYVSLSGEVFENVLLDTQGTLYGVDEADTHFDDLEDISLYVANSAQAKQAFVKHYLSYTLGEESPRFSPLYPEYSSFEQFKQMMKDLLMSITVIEREEK
ncbi:DUF1592 domain-containing protein [Vibrio coralliilyticus]|nr:DUF1592 domain-containing protein [Vibrio coralliilyticus]NRF82113.1 DUF1592 domain-containing protein [Vibrio coralliilyticus]